MGRFGNLTLILSLLWLALAGTAGADGAKVVSGSFYVAGATTGSPTTKGNFPNNVANSPILDLNLHIAPRCAYGVTFDLECKHPTHSDRFGFWPRQRKLVISANFPIPGSRCMSLFGEYERHYSGGFGLPVDWALAGIKCRF